MKEDRGFIWRLFMFYLQEVMRDQLPGFAASLLFLGISEIMLRIRRERITWLRRVAAVILGLSISVIFTLTLSPVLSPEYLMEGNDINWTPLRVLGTVSTNPVNFYGNILLFVPFGFLLVLYSVKCQRLHVTLLAGAGLSLFIELMQLFSIRCSDIDDMILNTAGTLCGYLLGRSIILFSPAVHKKIGVSIERHGKCYKKRNDAGGVIALAALILISFYSIDYGAGFSRAPHEAAFPMIKENPAVSEQIPEVSETETISADISARNAYLWNISLNKVMYEKESDQKIAPASTAKMLTALTVLDHCEEKEEVLVGPEVRLIAEDASRAWLNPGCRLTVRQLLHALLIPSGNDAAYALAVYTGRKLCGDQNTSVDESLSAFAYEMNQKATRIGAIHSNFIKPDGYDAEGQYTTAYDLACIARAFCESGLLSKIAGSGSVDDLWLSGQEVMYNNTNELIQPDSRYYYENATGLKTGKSEAAGCCLVSSARIEDERYICVIMGSTEEGRWTDSLTLYHAIEQ